MALADEISSAIHELQLQNCVRELSSNEAGDAVLAAENHFLSRRGVLWWWEALKPEFPCAISQPLDHGFLLLPTICPDIDVWLFASDDEFPPWPVFGGRPAQLARVIGECHVFEYALVSPDLQWIVFENHHNVLVAVGEPVRSRLLQNAG